jgi:hypothetical protein
VGKNLRSFFIDQAIEETEENARPDHISREGRPVVSSFRAGRRWGPWMAERNKLSPYRAFWSITLGSAEALYIEDKLGNFNPGKEADLVVLDWNGGPRATSLHQSMVTDGVSPSTMEQAAHLLFGIAMVGDDRAIDET